MATSLLTFHIECGWWQSSNDPMAGLDNQEDEIDSSQIQILSSYISVAYIPHHTLKHRTSQEFSLAFMGREITFKPEATDHPYPPQNFLLAYWRPFSLQVPLFLCQPGEMGWLKLSSVIQDARMNCITYYCLIFYIMHFKMFISQEMAARTLIGYFSYLALENKLKNKNDTDPFRSDAALFKPCRFVNCSYRLQL